MSFKYICPFCGQHLEFDNSFLNLQYNCPVCHNKFLITFDQNNNKEFIKAKTVKLEKPKNIVSNNEASLDNINQHIIYNENKSSFQIIFNIVKNIILIIICICTTVFGILLLAGGLNNSSIFGHIHQIEGLLLCMMALISFANIK